MWTEIRHLWDSMYNPVFLSLVSQKEKITWCKEKSFEEMKQ